MKRSADQLIVIYPYLNTTIISEAWFPTSRNRPVTSKLKCRGKAPKLECIVTKDKLPFSGHTLKQTVFSFSAKLKKHF